MLKCRNSSRRQRKNGEIDQFTKNELKWRTGGGGKQLAYIDARCAMKRLDEVVGSHNWQDDYKSIDGRTVCNLSVRINGEWITKSDGAGDTNIEGEKGGLSDAFKRAAVKFGVGRYLYYIPFNVSNFEQLPDWCKPNNKRINHEQCQYSFIAIKTALDLEDFALAKEAWQELESHEQDWVWRILSTKQKDAVRSLDAAA